MKKAMLAEVGSRTRYRFVGFNTQEPAKSAVTKEMLYGFGVIPAGLLDHEIFTRYRPQFDVLYALFQRIKPLLSTLRLDAQQVWPLVALMGMEEALDELLKANPNAVDNTGRDALVYLTIGGHQEILKKRLGPPGSHFDWRRYSRLIDDAVLVYGDQSMLNFLMQTYGFGLWRSEDPKTGLPALYGLVSCGFAAHFWGLVEVLGQSGVVDLHEAKCLPVLAAKNKHWALSDDLIGRGFELTQQDQAQLVFYAARDSLERFLKLMKSYSKINYKKYSVNGNNVYTSACSGGNVEVVDYLLEKRWFSETAPDWRKSRATGLQLAAQGGHKVLVQHFFSKFGLKLADQKDAEGWDIFDYVAMSGDWDYFQELAKICHPHDHDWVPPMRATDRQSPLDCAIRHGHLYFAQQFVAKYGNSYLRHYEGVITEAAESGNPSMRDWVGEQTQVIRSQEAHERGVAEDLRFVEAMFKKST